MAAAVNDDRIFDEEHNHEVYKYVDHLGQGGFGDVYSVIRISDNAAFAVKKVGRSKRNVEREGVLLRELQHPYILKCFDVIHEKNYIYFLMELCTKGNLKGYIEKKYKSENTSVPEEKIIRWMTQIALGLEFLHSKTIVHRDIKPENILISGDQDDCKLADFGLLHFEDGPSTTSIGTLAFVPPEMFKAFSATRDMWAFGIVVHYFCTYELPFDPNTRNHEEAVKASPPPRIDPRKYSAKLQKIIDGLLSYKTSSRLSAMTLVQITYVELPESFTSTIPSSQLERIKSSKILTKYALLHDAVQKGNAKLVEELLTECCELVNIPDNNGRTPLQLAVNELDWAVVKILFKFNSTIVGLEFERELMKDELRNAAVHGELEKLEIILQICPALINEEYSDWFGGWTVLHAASYHGRLNIVDCLLKYGADPLQRDNYNETPRDWAIRWKRGEVAEKLEESERQRQRERERESDKR